MEQDYDDIHYRIEGHLRRQDYLGAVEILKNELARESLSKASFYECHYWLGVCWGSAAGIALHREHDKSRGEALYRSAESAYVRAIEVRPDSVEAREALTTLLLDRRKDPAVALSIIEAVERQNPEDKDEFELFQLHAALMLLGTTRCLLSRFDVAMNSYRAALGEHMRRRLREPNLGSFYHLADYGVRVPPQVRDEIVALVRQFKRVRPDTISFLQLLPVTDASNASAP